MESGFQDSSVLYTQEEIKRYEWRKVLFLTLSFFCVIGAYTIAKELKDSIFAYTVGREYIPWAKYAVMFALVPAIFAYSKLVDSMRRYYLLCFYSIIYAVLGIVFALLLAHPTIGLANTNTSPWRFFGWIFYFFVEGCSPFVVSVFWAFANSVSSPAGAKKNYGFMVSGSKLGGALTAGLAWWILSLRTSSGQPWFSDLASHQLLLVIFSLLLSVVPFVLIMMMRKVPGKFLHGYEAVYKLEKKKKKAGKEKTGVFAGLGMFLKYPYVMGIFGMVYFYEIIATVLSYLRLTVAESNSASLSDVSGYLFKIICFTHMIGFAISLVGTSQLLSLLGERVCLMLIPLTSGIALLYYMTASTTGNGLIIAFIALKSINYAFSWPVRESLYIPTVKEIKFKSKSWIDAFGSKFAKSSGSTFNLAASWLGPALFMPAHSIFFSAALGMWFVTAFLLGKRYEWAVEHEEVIGANDDESVEIAQ